MNQIFKSRHSFQCCFLNDFRNEILKIFVLINRQNRELILLVMQQIIHVVHKIEFITARCDYLKCNTINYNYKDF
jgi:hypothetical protein